MEVHSSHLQQDDILIGWLYFVQIHLSFSLDHDPDLDEESKTESQGNILIRAVLNVVNHFAAIIGKTKDAELRYSAARYIYY